MAESMETRLGEHRAAVDHFLASARALPADRWLVPRAAGKWTPAEEARHVVLSYRAFIADLRGERKMRLKGTPLHRWIWRLIGLTTVLHARRIPRAVRAPREVRPEGETASRDVLLDELERAVVEFESVFRDTLRARPGTTVTHPYFGELSLVHAIILAEVHTRHHAAFLPDPMPV